MSPVRIISVISGPASMSRKMRLSAGNPDHGKGMTTPHPLHVASSERRKVDLTHRTIRPMSAGDAPTVRPPRPQITPLVAPITGKEDAM